MIDDPTARGPARQGDAPAALQRAASTTTSRGTSCTRATSSVAVARVEVLYPFPREQIVELIASYPNLEEIIWVQEEPKNMGARRFMFTRNRERELVPGGREARLHRPPVPGSPGEGYPAAHHIEQDRIVARR